MRQEARKRRKSCMYCDSHLNVFRLLSTQYARFWFHSDNKITLDVFLMTVNYQLQSFKCTLLPKLLEPHSSAHSV